MIGDREYGQDPAGQEPMYGPLSAMLRLNPPDGRPIVWIERYDCLVVVRYGSSPGVVREQNYPTVKGALCAIARVVASLCWNGYTPVPGDDPAA